MHLPLQDAVIVVFEARDKRSPQSPNTPPPPPTAAGHGGSHSHVHKLQFAQMLLPALERARNCAVALLRRMDHFPIYGHEERLRLHVAMGVGAVHTFVVGGVQGHWTYLVSGTAFDGISEALKAAAPGEKEKEESPAITPVVDTPEEAAAKAAARRAAMAASPRQPPHSP